MFTLQTLYKDLKRLFSYYALLILDNKVLLHDAEKKNNVIFWFYGGVVYKRPPKMSRLQSARLWEVQI